jgi:hypothetical protein
MFASTNVFTAGAEFGAVPFVTTVKTGEPPTDSVDDALPVTMPGVGDVNVIVHCPDALVFAPAVVHVPVGAVCVAPLLSTNVTATCSPTAGTKPAPAFLVRVTVKVCDPLIGFVALGAIVIAAQTTVIDAVPVASP